MSSDNQNSSFSAVVDTPSTNQSSPSPQMFKLNVDCFEHLFDWLSLDQLLVFRRTCKRMKQVVDYYIKLNYPELLRLRIYNRRRWLDFHNNHLNYFEWIKQLSIENVKLTDTATESIAYVLNRLEVLKLNYVHIDGDFYEIILKHCPLLKYVNVTTNHLHHRLSETMIGTRNDWLLRQYPILEHFEMHIGINHEEPLQYVADLLAFFVRNPQIRIFSIDSKFLEENHRSLLESNIKFDRLDIHMDHRLHLISNLTNILYENNFYKQLHLFNSHAHLIKDEEQYLSTMRNLEKLHLYCIPENCPIPVVESIKELSIGWFECSLMEVQPMVFNPKHILQIVAENFVNLQRVDMQFVHMRDIWSFVCYAPKLQQIRVYELILGDRPIDSDFIAMNEERKKLVGARKVKILIDEDNFLEFKRAKKINLSLIELRRSDMCYLEFEFDSM